MCVWFDGSVCVCDPQVETGDAQADGDAVRASLMMQPREMHGAEHVSIRLSESIKLLLFIFSLQLQLSGLGGKKQVLDLLGINFHSEIVSEVHK